jgi:predicted lysophospholipase L1 biosynthesis ABC-type transport system permease subunit
MNVAFGALVVAALLVASGGALVTCQEVMRAFRRDWSGIPPERRRRLWFIYGLMVMLGAALAVLLVLKPRTAVWIILISVGGFMLFTFGAVAAQARSDVRRANRRRLGPPSG